jgi:archaemetzincin
MNFNKIVLFFSAYLLFASVSCNTSGTTSSPNHSMAIIIQPFDDVDSAKSAFVYKQILKVYPLVRLYKPIRIPSKAYYPARNRYRADSIIAFLSQKSPNGQIVIGLTSKDISTTKDSIMDWGVMGLGYRPGNACVASDFRLNKMNRYDQFFKVALHELGHTQGLPHCSEKTCFMRSAEGRNPTNEEVDFCTKCKKELIKKGWQFNLR